MPCCCAEFVSVCRLTYLPLYPAGDAQQHNPLSALFANMKVSNAGTSRALTPPPHIKPPSSSQAPPSQTSNLTPPPHLKTSAAGQPAPSQTLALTPPSHLKTPSGSLPGPQHQSATPPALLTPSFLRQRSTLAVSCNTCLVQVFVMVIGCIGCE